MKMRGKGNRLVNHDFFAFNSEYKVWNGSAFVTWVDGDLVSYRIAPTQPIPGTFIADAPIGTVFYELRVRAGTVDGSYPVWDKDQTVELKTELIQPGIIFAQQSVVNNRGQLLVDIIIGDDYLVANDNALEIPVAASVTPTACSIGFYRDHQTSFEIEGEPGTVDDGISVLVFEWAKEITEGKKGGPWEYSYSITDSGGRVKTKGYGTVKFINKRTETL